MERQGRLMKSTVGATAGVGEAYYGVIGGPAGDDYLDLEEEILLYGEPAAVVRTPPIEKEIDRATAAYEEGMSEAYGRGGDRDRDRDRDRDSELCQATYNQSHSTRPCSSSRLQDASNFHSVKNNNNNNSSICSGGMPVDDQVAEYDSTMMLQQARLDVNYLLGGVRSGPGRKKYIENLLRVYAVTDPYCNKSMGRTLIQAVEAALKGGVTIVQIREKDAAGQVFMRQASQALALCRRFGVPLVINDRIDVAMAIGADGVHVGQNDLPASTIRALIGPKAIVGVSVSNEDEAKRAVADGADYIGAGALFSTNTKADAGDGIGLAKLNAIVNAAHPLPVVAIGGITHRNASLAIDAGASGVAVVSLIFKAPDVTQSVKILRNTIINALAENRSSVGRARSWSSKATNDLLGEGRERRRKRRNNNVLTSIVLQRRTQSQLQ
nr:thiamine biosynthetic bifunctional enzyme chloroplastic isoforms a & c (TPSC) [Polytomella parva]